MNEITLRKSVHSTQARILNYHSLKVIEYKSTQSISLCLVTSHFMNGGVNRFVCRGGGCIRREFFGCMDACLSRGVSMDVGVNVNVGVGASADGSGRERTGVRAGVRVRLGMRVCVRVWVWVLVRSVWIPFNLTVSATCFLSPQFSPLINHYKRF